MKLLPLSLLAVCSLAAGTASAVNYNGNAATGFGGTVGNGVLSVTSTSTNINFSFTAGGGLDNVVAFYLDTTPGGFASTSSFTDTADGGRTALSGFNPNENGGVGARTTATFPTGFGADYGITLEGGYAGSFLLSTGTFQNPVSANLTANGNVYTFSVLRSTLGLSATAGFRFVASYISPTAYRSNETIGASTTTVDPNNTGTMPNAGFSGTQTFTAANVFPAVPEPGSLACVGLGAVALAGAAVRRVRRSAA